MRYQHLLGLPLLLLLLLPALALAQNPVQANNVVASCGTPNVTYTAKTNNVQTMDVNGNLCTAASVSASISGFAPNGNYATLSVPSGSSSAATNLPTGAVVVVYNTGANTASVSLGATAATATEIQIPASSWMALTVGSNTQFTAYGVGGTTSLVLAAGTGLPTGAGGGSSGGGSGGNVNLTQVGGSSIALGSALSAASLPVVIASDNSVLVTQTNAALLDVTAFGNHSNASDAVATSATNIDVVADIYAWNGTGFDRLQDDASKNLKVAVNAALPAGANSIGTVVLGAGAASVGTVTAAQATASALNATVVQPTAANLNATVTGTVAATQSGNWAARVVGNAGAIMDFAGQNATSPANSLLIGGQFNTTPTTITSGNVSPFQLDSAGNLLVDVKVGGGTGGTSSSFAAAFPATGTAIGAKNGANMVNLTADASSNLDVNCVVGCAGGTTSNATSAVATSSTNGASVSWNYGFNGTTWDQFQVDGSKNLKTVVSAALPAGTNLMGKVGIDQTTPGTTNGVQINAALPAGTANIGVFGYAQGATTSGEVGPLIQGAVTTAAPTYTTAQTSPLSLDTAGNLRVNVVTGGTSGNVAQGSTTSGQTGPLVQCAVTTSAPTYTTAQTNPLSCDTSGDVRVTGGVTIGSTTSGQLQSLIGGAVTTAAPTYTTAQTDPLSIDTSGNLRVTNTTATPAGTNAIGNVGVAIASTTSGTVGPMIQGAVTTSPPTYTTAQNDPLSLDTAGNLRTSVLAQVGVSATASAVPSSANYTAANTGGNLVGLIQCNSYAKYDASTSGLTQLVALSGSTTIRVCGYSLHVGGTATNVSLSYGTGTNCGTGTTAMTPAWQFAANAGRVVAPGFWSGLATAASNALCINASGANAVQAEVWYTQF